MRDAEDRSLLDDTLLVFGSAISDGNRHNHDNLPIILAGGGSGAARPGRLVTHEKNTPLCNLYLSMLQKSGVEVDSFGDSTGSVQL
jgi:hypothetical protein